MMRGTILASDGPGAPKLAIFVGRALAAIIAGRDHPA